MKKWIGIFIIAVAAAGIGVILSQYLSQGRYDDLEAKLEIALQKTAVVQTNYNAPLATSTGAHTVENPDFVSSSAMATPAVVHIKSYYEQPENSDNPFGEIFGTPSQSQSSGSGVIISEDGFISTNFHVINHADKVEVVLNDKRSYTANVIGTDPTTDLALLKIEESGLAFLGFGNSDQVQIGEWVLAVGNPFNLTSTVTAGIVSAKGRSLNLLNEEFAIESFIQTDAAVNPGNSGGALINTKGELVGINTAIASETGSFAGYSFAVPVNIVQKVMKDLREFGEVQRGIIGVQIRNINADFAERRNLNTLSGAYVSGTIPGGAAEAAGIIPGDVITRVDQTDVNSSAALQESIGTYRPGDRVNLTIIRDGEAMTVKVILRNREGRTELGSKRSDREEEPVASIESLGAELVELSVRDKFEYSLSNGVKVTDLEEGLLKKAGIEQGFIITRINKEYVERPSDVVDLLQDADGGVLIEGITSQGDHKFFAFDQ